MKKMFGDKAVPDIATLAAWDGTRLIQEAVAALGADAGNELKARAGASFFVED